MKKLCLFCAWKRCRHRVLFAHAPIAQPGLFIITFIFMCIFFAHINIYFAISILHSPSKFAVDYCVFVATLVAFAQLIIPSFAVRSEEIYALRNSGE